MPKAVRAILLIPLAAIAYVAISVYCYGLASTRTRSPLYSTVFMLLWFPLIVFNTWAIATALPQDAGRETKRAIGLGFAVVIAVIATIVFMSIAFNAYGT
jgi:hypothetical protein